MAGRRVVYTEDAEADLAAIWDHIAEDNIAPADRVIDRLRTAGSSLATMPRMGKARPELRRDCRSFPVGHIVIFYRELKDAVEILHIYHGARDIESLF